MLQILNLPDHDSVGVHNIFNSLGITSSLSGSTICAAKFPYWRVKNCVNSVGHFCASY